MRWIFLILVFVVACLRAEERYAYKDGGGKYMSGHVFIVSEWLAIEGKDQELWERAKQVLTLTRENEPGCIRAHVTRQLVHPASPGKSPYTIVLLQEYTDMDAFEAHVKSAYVVNFFETCVQDKATAIVKDWTCRLFSEGE
ncbi:MAG: antibiotic biosynthesis monooxygenase [Verrucomicrobia bacterium]|nr:antibiotic biosynthesis monooxygenase [Verrucomicrobiota bacterium]